MQSYLISNMIDITTSTYNKSKMLQCGFIEIGGEQAARRPTVNKLQIKGTEQTLFVLRFMRAVKQGVF